MSNIAAYEEFLRGKVQVSSESGFEIPALGLHTSLKPHQRDMVLWAARRGKALLAASFGLGKTRIQVELLNHAHSYTKKPVLVICPLGVKHQFIVEDGPPMAVNFEYVRNDEEAAAAKTPFLITNYERVRDGHITQQTLSVLGAVSLDEGAILGNLGTKTQDQFNHLLGDIPYRWVATATPAPNDYRQLIYFADFLDAMDQGQALTRFFGRNPDIAGDLQLMPHMEKEFWLWVASWALFVDMPSDLGYDDTGYVMPDLEVHWHRIAADHEKAFGMTNREGQAYLLKDTAAGVQQAMKEKRDSLQARIAEAFTIVDGLDPADQLVIWCNLNDEQSAIEKGLKERGITFSSVQGSQTPEEQEERLYDWKSHNTRVLISKAQMLGSGVNLQQAHIAVYVGLDFKFRDFIQSIHRLQRYGQTHTVEVHCIHTDAEDHVIDILLGKWTQHDEMVAKMRAIVKEYGLTNEALASEMRRTLGVTRQERKGQFYTLVNNDCVLEVMGLEDNSIDQVVTSIPFGNHYEYVASLNDFGHNPTDSDFWVQMDFLIPELLRVLKPGRFACIHAKDRLLYGHQTLHGLMEVDYFTHDCARAFRRHGFVSYGEIFIPTDVVRENNSTNRLGWTRQCQDGTTMGVGLSEKVLLFRKPQTDRSQQWADERVVKDKAEYSRGRWQVDAHSLWRSNGKGLETPADNPDLLAGMDGSQVYNWYRDWSKDAPYDYHQHVAFNEAMGDRLPARFMLMPPQAPAEYEETIWTNILFMRTLNMHQAKRRQEKHLCPLPLDVVERLIVRYSNPGDVVLDPFGGIGTVPFMAVKLGRRSFASELNPVYFDAAHRYLVEAEAERQAPTLFDMSELAKEAV